MNRLDILNPYKNPSLWSVKMRVKIVEYGYSTDYRSYYVTYKVTDLDRETLDKLKERLEDPIKVVCNDLYLTTYFDTEYFPFGSEESKRNPEDFAAREEIEMTAYLLDLVED